MTPGERRQAEVDRQFGQHERRMMERARFGSPFAADLFDLGTDMARSLAPQPTLPPPTPEPELTKEERSRHAWGE